jgi:hypothetical protein
VITENKTESRQNTFSYLRGKTRMRREHIVIFILTVILVLLSIALIIVYFGVQPFEAGKSWGWDSANGNNYWSGTERSKTTNTFMITGEEWRISWGFSGGDEHTNCIVTIYDAYRGDIIRSLQLFSEEEGYLNVTGRFYLTLYFQASFDNWYVEVMKYQ